MEWQIVARGIGITFMIAGVLLLLYSLYRSKGKEKKYQNILEMRNRELIKLRQRGNVSDIPQMIRNIEKQIKDAVNEQRGKQCPPEKISLIMQDLFGIEINNSSSGEQTIIINERIVEQIKSKLGLGKKNKHATSKVLGERTRSALDGSDAGLFELLKERTEYQVLLEKLDDIRSTISSTGLNAKIESYFNDLYILYSMKLFSLYGEASTDMSMFSPKVKSDFLHLGDEIEKYMRKKQIEINELLEKHLIGDDS